MSARTHLAEILDQWLALTKSEGVAIQASNWTALRQIQNRKSSLPQSLAQVLRQCAAEEPSVPASLREKAGRIISLLTRNSEALKAQLRQVRHQEKTLNQAARNLQRIQHSYVRPLVPAAWQSYS